MDSFTSLSETSGEVVEASQPFVGRWGRLVSRTNWEKGKIIAEWREALIAAEAAATDYSDETWSRLVGQVTAQHVGRLRRTYARFHAVQETYAGLYWSHFFAALDWNDAELWLEGAVQNQWSVSEMRRARWQATGGAPAEERRADDVVAAEVDEDAVADEPAAAGRTTDVRDPSEFAGDGEYSGPQPEGPDFGDESAVAEAEQSAASEPPFDFPTPQRPFENLAALPADLHEAFEAFKLAILHHKMAEWREVAVADVVAALRALEQLATAPS